MCPSPRVMGILNVTPDSFHDGGAFLTSDTAVRRGLQMADQGADLVDVGGESTRPGARPITTGEELERVIPVITELRRLRPGLRVSVDTSKASVAEAALRAGASMVNDVTALGDPDMGAVVAGAEAELVLMHMRGTPADMQDEPTYIDVQREVRDFLGERVEEAIGLGIPRQRIWIDPGIGFGKSPEHNLALVRGIPYLMELGSVLVGASRKSFIGAVLGFSDTARRLEGSLAVVSIAAWLGAGMVRVHDVLETRRVVDMAHAVKTGVWK